MIKEKQMRFLTLLKFLSISMLTTISINASAISIGFGPVYGDVDVGDVGVAVGDDSYEGWVPGHWFEGEWIPGHYEGDYAEPSDGTIWVGAHNRYHHRW